MRAGAMGIPAFYTPAGVGTYVETGGFPIKFKKGTKEVEEYTQQKEVEKKHEFFFFLMKEFFKRKEYSMEENSSWKKPSEETFQ
jgi:hypothetical protein